MSNRPRPLGNKARALLQEADDELASAMTHTEILDSNEVMERLERQLLASRALRRISEARRLLAEAQTVGA